MQVETTETVALSSGAKLSMIVIPFLEQELSVTYIHCYYHQGLRGIAPSVLLFKRGAKATIIYSHNLGTHTNSITTSDNRDG